MRDCQLDLILIISGVFKMMKHLTYPQLLKKYIETLFSFLCPVLLFFYLFTQNAFYVNGPLLL